MSTQQTNSPNDDLTFGAPVAQDTPASAISANPANAPNPSDANDDLSFGAPVQTDTPASSIFKAPRTGHVLNPGTPISVNGATGTIQGQHPNGKAIVKWDAPSQNTISAVPEPTGVLGKVEQWANNVSDDIKYGTDKTGVGSVLKAMGAHGVYNGNSQGVGDFMASLPLGLLKATKGAAELPQTGKHVQGAEDLASGALDAATIPGAFVAPEAGEVAGAGLNKAGEVAASGIQKALPVKTAIRARTVVFPQAVQDMFQGLTRTIINGAAKEHGVPVSDAESIRDVANEVSSSLQGKAKAAYQALDNATGGKAQRFRDAMKNLNQKIREVNGIDPDAEGAYIEKLNQVQDAHDAAMEEARAAGVDPSTLQTANETFRKSKAMLDLSKQIRASTEGLPAGLKDSKGASAEVLNPAKLFPRITKLYDSGRLQDALGSDRAEEFMRQTDMANNVTQMVKNARQTLKQIGKYAAGGGLGYEGYETLKHLFGGE